jgi:uncharacterized protein (DUF58 family)
VTGALSALTTRGRSFLAAGLACAACSFLLGERDLLRLGIFLLALPLVAAATLHRTRFRLSCTRRLEPARVTVGRPATVTLRLENVSRIPTGILLVEDALPYLLGGRPRFVLERVEGGGVREVVYTLRSDVRGRFSVGPVVVRLTDPFGLAELTRSFTATDALVVTPEIAPLPRTGLAGEWTGGGDSRARSVATCGEEDVAPREYREGDDLRRVHWRSTARYGELMVRREEQPWQSRAVVLLDARAGAHRGDGPTSSFEWAVSAAASVSVHLARAGYAVRFLDDSGEEVSAGGELGDAALLDALAVAERSRASTLARAVERLRRGGEGLVVAVLGSLEPGEVDSLTRLRHGSAASVAVLLDPSSWLPGSAPDPSYDANVALLQQAGWRVLPARQRTRLDALWPLAAAHADPGRLVPSAVGPVATGSAPPLRTGASGVRS